MEFLITRAELCLLFQIGRTSSYAMQDIGVLEQPVKWCGSKQLFCMRTNAYAIATSQGFDCPCDETLITWWNSIMAMRLSQSTKAKTKQLR